MLHAGGAGVTRYGYARVSTREQNPESQIDALTRAGLAPENIVIDKISGKLASRPKLDSLPWQQTLATAARSIRLGSTPCLRPQSSPVRTRPGTSATPS